MPHLAVDGNDYARTIDPFRDLRSRNADYAAMPAFAGNHGHVRMLAGFAIGQFRYRERHNLLLYLLALLVPVVEVLR